MTTAAPILPVMPRLGRTWMVAMLLAACQVLSAATNPDPCPSDKDCSSWVCVKGPAMTSTYESGPYTVCPSESGASWTIAEALSEGHRTFTVPDRDDCDKELFFGVKNKTWSWRITGPATFTAQTGSGVTATLTNSRPSIPGAYNVAWSATADWDDECCQGTATDSYSWSFDIPAPSGTATADPPEQTVCLHPDMVVVDLLGDGIIERSISFAFAPTEDGCSHNIRWQLSGGEGLGLQPPLSGSGTSATAKLFIPINSINRESTVTCVFSSEDTGADLATATAKVKLVNAAWQQVPPQLLLAPKPPTGQTVQACLAFAGDFAPVAQPVDGSDDLVCPDGQNIRHEPIALVLKTEFWSGVGGFGFGATRHVVINGPGNYSLSCRVLALFFGVKSGLVLKRETATWRIKVNKVDLLLKPKLVWRDGPRLNPNPAAPGDLVEVIATAESIEGRKICKPNPAAPIAVTPAEVRFELPPNLDPLNPDLWVEDGKIRVGPNAQGSYPIKVIAEAHIIDPADIALCGGDLALLERIVHLRIPEPRARGSIDDAMCEPHSTVSIPWTLTNTGRLPDLFSFQFAVEPQHRPGDATGTFGLEVVGWTYFHEAEPGNVNHADSNNGTVLLEPEHMAQGTVSVRVWNGARSDAGSISFQVHARNTEVVNISGGINVVSVSSVEWMAVMRRRGPLVVISEANDHPVAPVGLAYDPGAKAPTGSLAQRVTIRAKATAQKAGIGISAKVFDPDDPSANNNEVDADNKGGDNRGTSRLVSGYALTNADGEAYFEFDVSTFAGDNYRVACTTNSGDFAALTDDNIGVSVGGEPETKAASFSPCLTIWRTLHLEVDSMKREADGWLDKRPDNKLFVLTSYSIGTTGTSGSLVILRSSGPLYSPAADFYQGGYVEIGASRFQVVKNTANAFSSDEIRISVPNDMLAIIPGAVDTVLGIHDDDGVSWKIWALTKTTQLPTYPGPGPAFSRAYGEAYIRVVRALDQYNPNKLVNFVSNLSDWDVQLGIGWNNSQDINSTAEYWSTLIVMGYQGPSSSDSDPNDEGADLGVTRLPFNQSLVFVEAIRDFNNGAGGGDTLEQVMAHEAAHVALGGGHTPNTGADLMHLPRDEQTAHLPTRNFFIPKDLAKFRSVVEYQRGLCPQPKRG